MFGLGPDPESKKTKKTKKKQKKQKNEKKHPKRSKIRRGCFWGAFLSLVLPLECLVRHLGVILGVLGCCGNPF